MLSLMRKDFVLQKSSIVLLPILLLYLAFNTSILWIGIVFSIAISWNSFSMDKKTPIHILLNSMPYTRKEIVSSKYIGAFAFTFMVALAIFIGNYFINDVISDWKVFVLMFSIVLTVISFIFPFSYKFNGNQLLIVAGAVFGIYLVVLSLFVNNLHDRIREFVGWLLALDDNHLYFMMTGAVLILYAGSWLLSMHIYKKKVF